MGRGYRAETWRREVLYAYAELLDELSSRTAADWDTLIDQAVLSFLERQGLGTGADRSVTALESAAREAVQQRIDAAPDDALPLLTVFALAYSACARQSGLIDDEVLARAMQGITDLSDADCEQLPLPASHLPDDERGWLEEIEGCWRNRAAGSAHTQEGPNWQAEPDDLIGMAVQHASLARELTFSGDVYPFFRKHLERLCYEREADWPLLCTTRPQYAFACAYILFHQVLGVIEEEHGDRLRQRLRERSQNEPSGPGELLLLTLRLDGGPLPVWRRVLCAPTDSLLDLHQVIQACLLWHGQHPFSFVHEHRSFSASGPSGGPGSYDAAAFPLSGFFRGAGDSLRYRCGSSDAWELTVELEQRVVDQGQPVPHCLDGAHPAPAESGEASPACTATPGLSEGEAGDRGFDRTAVERELGRLRSQIR